MKILICNDDGIFSPGIIAIAKQLISMGDVTVVAPDRERSAASNSLTLSSPLRVKKVDFPVNVKHAFSVTGTPADCAKIALSTLIEGKPDILVSGINKGPNMCVDIFYSGTVAAALEGTFKGILSFSLSVNSFQPDIDFTIAAKKSVECIGKIIKNKMSANSLYNINVPAVPESEIKGVKITKFGKLDYKEVYEKRLDPYNRPYYWINGTPEVISKDENCDIIAVKNNFISITPIKPDLTDDKIMASLENCF